MSDIVLVKAVRPFDGAEGFKSKGSPPFKVLRRRAAELLANGLVEEVAGDGVATGRASKPASNTTPLSNKAALSPADKPAAKQSHPKA